MNLKSFSDPDLINHTDRTVNDERAAITKVLHAFREIERRRLYSAYKYESLFDMAMRRYGYTEDQAQYRISAMRLLQELPEIEEKIASGALTLTHMNMARSHFRNEKRQGKKIFSRAEKLQLLQKLEKTSKRESQEFLLSVLSAPMPLPREEIRPLNDEKVLMRVVADKCVEQDIKKLKGLFAHSDPDMSTGELLKKLCELGLKEWSPARAPKRESSSNDDAVVPGPVRVTLRNEKANQAAINRQVWQRDGQKCTNCGSTHALERDHVDPRAKGGESSLENLRLLCRKCNQRAAIEQFGLEKMDRYLNGRPQVKSLTVKYVRAPWPDRRRFELVALH